MGGEGASGDPAGGADDAPAPARVAALEAALRDERAQNAALEREVGDLATLHAAGSRLHASLSPPRVLDHVREVLAQLVGAEAYVVYVVDAAQQLLHPIASDGVPEAGLAPVAVGEGVVGAAFVAGVPSVEPLGGPPSRGSVDAPLAVVPLRADGQVVGVLTVVALLPQKRGWAEIDDALFRLLAAQAGPALLAAALHARAPGPAAALAALREQLCA